MIAGSNAIAAPERALGLAGADSGTQDRGAAPEADTTSALGVAELANATVALAITRLDAITSTNNRRRVVRGASRLGPIGSRHPSTPYSVWLG